QGTTIFLTTHYLEEADALSDRLAIMDHGEIVVGGTPRELKQQISGDAVHIKPKSDGNTIEKLSHLLKQEKYVRDVQPEDEACRFYVNDGTDALANTFHLLEKQNISLDTVSLMQRSLDDVFL